MKLKVVIMLDAPGETVASELAGIFHKAGIDAGFDVAAITVEREASKKE